MNVFDLRDKLIDDYASFVSSFVNIRDLKIRKFVEDEFAYGTLWPQPLVQLNPSFEQGESVDELVEQVLSAREDSVCEQFSIDKYEVAEAMTREEIPEDVVNFVAEVYGLSKSK